jgi:hypothetical protein
MENNEVVSGGVEFLKKLGIKEISERTFIHEVELKKFLNGEFQGINKTKAMGFIQILEREFNIDLDDLKNQYQMYMNENVDEKKEPKQSLMMEEVEKEEKKRGFFSFIFLIAAIGSIAYLINKYNLLDFTTPNDIKVAKVTEEKSSDTSLNLEQLTKKDDTDKKEEKKLDIANNNEENKNNTSTNTNNIKDSEKEKISLEDVLESDESQSKTSDNNPNNSNTDTQNNELDLSKLNADLEQEKNSKEVDSKNIEEDTASSETEETSNSEAVMNEIYIIPNSKVWIGTIDIDTLKKKDFLAPRGKRVDIDTSSDKLIMIGHKFVKIYLNDKLVKFKRKGPIRFKYVDGELIEINREEFNKLAKGRQW